MAFEDTGWIELRSITLLFGRNSSGKSVLIRALRLLKQSFENNVILKINDEYGVELGEESDLYHGNYDKEYFSKDERDKNQSKLPTLSFGFRIRLEAAALGDLNDLLKYHYQNQAPSSLQKYSEEYDKDEIGFILNIRWDYLLGGFYLSAFRLECQDGLIFSANKILDPYLLDNLSINWIFDTDILQSYKEPDGENIWADVDIRPLPSAPLLPGLILNTNFQYTQNAQIEFSRLTRILGFLQDSIIKFLSGIIYIRPLRFAPELVYMFDMHTQEKWKKLGWSGYSEFLHPPIDTSKSDLIDIWVKRLNLGKRVSVKYIYTSMGTGSAQVMVDTGTNERHISNVGFGFSQVLPVIVESVLASKGSLVIIEQPELHLHPRAQAEIADLFISTCQDNENRFLIETHSEHILLRLRRRIAELKQQEFTFKQPRAYYIEREEGKSSSSIYAVDFDHRGNIQTEAPDFHSFFADDLKEVMELTKLRLEDGDLWT